MQYGLIGIILCTDYILVLKLLLYYTSLRHYRYAHYVIDAVLLGALAYSGA